MCEVDSSHCHLSPISLEMEMASFKLETADSHEPCPASLTAATHSVAESNPCSPSTCNEGEREEELGASSGRGRGEVGARSGRGRGEVGARAWAPCTRRARGL